MPEVELGAALTDEEKARVVVAAEHAAQHSPWYATHLAAADFTEAPTFEHVPVLTEADLAQGYYDSDDSHGDQGTHVTSGTTSGVGRKVSWPPGDHRGYVEQRARLFSSFLDTSCRTACADLGTGHAQASALEIFGALSLQAHEIDVTTPIDGHVAALRRWRPDLLYTMPVILERIVGASGPGYIPKWIVVLGDLAPRSWRRAMEQRLGMVARHIVDVFGSIEVGAIAYSDDAHDRYLFHEHIIPEQIAPAAPRSERGELLVLTSTERDGFPAVRYVAGDMVSGLRSVVVAGQTRWAFDAHLGREGTMIKHGEALSLAVVTGCIAAVAPGVTWSLRRDGYEAVVEIDARSYSPAVASEIGRAVRAAHPAVDAMIGSGLIGDIRVEPRAFPDTRSKRVIR